MNANCRRCADCRGMSHHWTPDPLAYDDDEFEPGDYACKHCDQRGDDCPDCGGVGVLDSGGSDQSGKFIEVPCERCMAEGVVPLTEQEYSEAMHRAVMDQHADAAGPTLMREDYWGREVREHDE